MLETLRRDVHPPLYFLAAHYWMLLPVPDDPIVRLRALSALFTLAASAAALGFALPRLGRGAMWFCALMALSPCLILYGRMARSYSLQILVVVLSMGLLSRLLKDPAPARSIAFGLAAALVLYTHYVAGAAVALAANIALFARGRSVRPLLLPNAVMLAAYLPWIAAAVSAASKWEGRAEVYQVSGSFVVEQSIKLGYLALSFLFGESVPWWLFFRCLPLGAALLWLAWAGRRAAQEWAGPVALAGAVAFIGVSRWASYPFLPARLIFLLPFLYLLLAHGAEVRPLAGRIILGTLLAASTVSLWSYYHIESFLNPGYAVPYARIASDIGPDRASVVAGLLTDSRALRHYLAKGIYYLPIEPPMVAETAAAELVGGPWTRVCVVRQTHDSSSGTSSKLSGPSEWLPKSAGAVLATASRTNHKVARTVEGNGLSGCRPSAR